MNSPGKQAIKEADCIAQGDPSPVSGSTTDPLNGSAMLYLAMLNQEDSSSPLTRYSV